MRVLTHFTLSGHLDTAVQCTHYKGLLQPAVTKCCCTSTLILPLLYSPSTYAIQSTSCWPAYITRTQLLREQRRGRGPYVELSPNNTAGSEKTMAISTSHVHANAKRTIKDACVTNTHKSIQWNSVSSRGFKLSFQIFILQRRLCPLALRRKQTGA